MPAVWSITVITPSFAGTNYTAAVQRQKGTRPGEPIFTGTDADGTSMFTMAYITDDPSIPSQLDIWTLPVIYTGGASRAITLKATLDGTQKTKTKPIVRDGAGGGGRRTSKSR